MSSQNKIFTWEQALEWRKMMKKSHKSVVFTNGCFDILHAGHVAYLEEASKLGDALIVALNSDDSVRALEKSPARPLQSEFGRSRVMAALEFVSAVIIFSEPTPKEVIEYLTPDTLVKGADYSIENIVGADWVLSHGGTVKTIEFLPGFSTSSIEKKILAEHGLDRH